VWAAKDVENGNMVAMKQIKITDKEGFPRTALREIRIMSKAKHENVLSLNEVVWADKGDRVDAYIVMNLYDFDLRRVLDRMGIRFSGGEVKLLFLQLLRGVKYMHDNSLLHRDLKTENILLDLRGNLKICDFGLSRQHSPEGKHTPVVITLWYRPPELILGPVDYSREIDSWSLGCILGEIVRGSILFKGDKEADQLDKIFRLLGSPTDETWPDFYCLPGLEVIQFNVGYTNSLRNHFQHTCLMDGLNQQGYDLLKKLLCLDPRRRISARAALAHPYFGEEPYPVSHIAIDSKPEYLNYMERKQREMMEQRGGCSDRESGAGGAQQGYSYSQNGNLVSNHNGQQLQPPPPPHIVNFMHNGNYAGNHTALAYNYNNHYDTNNGNGTNLSESNDLRNSNSGNNYPTHPPQTLNNINTNYFSGNPNYRPPYALPPTFYPHPGAPGGFMYPGFQGSYPFPPPPYMPYNMGMPPPYPPHMQQQQQPPHQKSLSQQPQSLQQPKYPEPSQQHPVMMHNGKLSEKDGW